MIGFCQADPLGLERPRCRSRDRQPGERPQVLDRLSSGVWVNSTEIGLSSFSSISYSAGVRVFRCKSSRDPRRPGRSASASSWTATGSSVVTSGPACSASFSPPRTNVLLVVLDLARRPSRRPVHLGHVRQAADRRVVRVELLGLHGARFSASRELRSSSTRSWYWRTSRCDLGLPLLLGGPAAGDQLLGVAACPCSAGRSRPPAPSSSGTSPAGSRPAAGAGRR